MREADPDRSVAVTRGLLTVLLERAAEADPESVSIALDATAAGDLEGETAVGTAGEGSGRADAGGDVADLDPSEPVLTHFYLPDAGGSVSAVFGVDLGRPSGSGRARFVSHPGGDPALTERDHLAEVVLVAVPPWTEGAVVAQDRSGRRVPLTVVDAEPPAERLE